MSTIHVLKNSDAEAVIKVYTTASSGETIDLSLEDWLTKDSQVYVTGSHTEDESAGEFATYTGSHVFITGIWWGLKKDKQLDIQRLINSVGPIVHGHYYLLNAGQYEFDHHGFADRIYADKDIRFVFDGPGHCIVKLRKIGWESKIETAQFGVYDDETAVGS
jgi:hypothetical protein